MHYINSRIQKLKKKKFLEEHLQNIKNIEISVREYVKHMAFYLKNRFIHYYTFLFFTYIFTLFVSTG